MQKTDLERHLVRESVEGGIASPEADPTVVGEASGEPAMDPSVNLPDLEEHGEETSRQQITLDQWSCLQERNRPKPELHERRREIALPENAVILPTQNTDLRCRRIILNRPSTCSTLQLG